jgi:hypothetical protein
VDELFTFGCLRHHVQLTGEPNFAVHHIGVTITSYVIAFDDMICPVDQIGNSVGDLNGGRRCKSSWKVGRG